VELLAERIGLGFWDWFLFLSAFGIFIFNLICSRIFKFMLKETLLAAMIGVAVLCLWGAERGWFLFAGTYEIL